MDNHEILLQQCIHNLIDEVTFKRFLEAYVNLWSRCRQGIHPVRLNQAMKNIHRYVERQGESITFNEGDYEIADYSVPCGLDQKKDTLTESNRSHHAPDYSELVLLLKHSLALFDRFAEKSGNEISMNEEMLCLAERIRKHLTGAERMIRARKVLQERYDPFKTEPQRDHEIDELLRYYRHLWNFAEGTEGKDREKADYVIVCMLGDIVPPFHEHGITEEKIGEYLHEKADWLEQNNIISFKKRDDVAKETLIHYLHDPEKWCREEPDK